METRYDGNIISRINRMTLLVTYRYFVSLILYTPISIKKTTAVWSTKPSSNEDSGVRHSFRYNASYIFLKSFIGLATLLATLLFVIVLALTLPLQIGPNRLTDLSFHRREGLPAGRLRNFGYHSRTTQVHMFSVNLVICPAQQNFCFCLPHSKKIGCPAYGTDLLMVWL